MMDSKGGYEQQGQQVGGHQVNIKEMAGDVKLVMPRREKVVPREIPDRAAHFYGRERLIERVCEAIQPGAKVTLYGIGGIGKTAIVAEVVADLLRKEELWKRFPDGVIFHSFYGRPSTDDALAHILNSLGVAWQGAIEDAARNVLGGKHLLLILDGAEEAAHLVKVTALAATCGVLITSRRMSDILGEGFLVRRLEPDDAQAVFRAWSKDRGVDEAANREICELVGYMPLAVTLAASYARSHAVMAGEFLRFLRASGLEALDITKRRQESVIVLLQQSTLQVGAKARRALAAAGQLALAPFWAEPIAATLQLNINETGKVLGELCNYGLLERPDRRYVVAHLLVHSYADQKMELDREALQRLVRYYSELFSKETGRGTEGLARLDGERLHVMQLIRTCEAREEWAALDSLVRAVEQYLDRQGYVVQRIEALETAVRAARAVGDQRGAGAYLRNLGGAYTVLGEMEEAKAISQIVP